MNLTTESETNKNVKTLVNFLRSPLHHEDGVIGRFSQLNGAMERGKGSQRFVYVPGTRNKNRILLVAHADTVWSGLPTEHRIVVENGIIRSGTPERGIGADDRAGCAMVWSLRELGHSVLITCGEESGQIGARFLMTNESNSDIREAIQEEHQFVVEFDRRNGTDFKCYGVGTDSFREYVQDQTGYTEPDRSSYTDIGVLCEKICGVNLSVGYRYEHRAYEQLDIAQWLTTLEISRKWLSRDDLPRFTRFSDPERLKPLKEEALA